MTPSEHRTWLSSVAFLDVVGFSNRSIEEQLKVKKHLDSVLRDKLRNVPREDYILLDRGDGAAACFLVEPEAAFFFSLHVRDTLVVQKEQRPPYDIRVGINLGPIKIIRDVNGDRAPVGEGINCAARVMDFAGPNEVLVARSFYDVISCQSQKYAALFSYLGVRADKHVREFELYEVVPPGSPRRLAPSRSEYMKAPPMATEESSAHPFSAVFLDRVRRALAHAIGPMADVFLTRAAKRSSSEDDLLECLGNALNDPDQRKAFFVQLGVHMHTDAHPSAPSPPLIQVDTAEPGALFDDSNVIAQAQLELAKYLGPIAAVLVRQAAANSADAESFVGQLSSKLDNPKVRADFLAAVESVISLAK